jgi:hypothetical protein
MNRPHVTPGAGRALELTLLSACMSATQSVHVLSSKQPATHSPFSPVCRTSYSDDLWRPLLKAAANNDSSAPDYLSSTDVSGLIADAYALAASRSGPISRFLDLVALLPARSTAFRDVPLRSADDVEGYQRLAWAVAALPLNRLSRAVDQNKIACVLMMKTFVDNFQLWPALNRMGVTKTTALSSTVGESWERRRSRADLLALVLDLTLALDRSVDPSTEPIFIDDFLSMTPDVRGDMMRLALLMDASYMRRTRLVEKHYVTSADQAERDRALLALTYAKYPAELLQHVHAGKVRHRSLCALLLHR